MSLITNYQMTGQTTLCEGMGLIVTQMRHASRVVKQLQFMAQSHQIKTSCATSETSKHVRGHRVLCTFLVDADGRWGLNTGRGTSLSGLTTDLPEIYVAFYRWQ